jgi:hypothetical protein
LGGRDVPPPVVRPLRWLAKEGLPVPRLSIVIPCLGTAADFDDTLVSVLQNRPAHCEVLVVHSQPYDDPYGLGGEVRFLQVTGKPTLVQLVNAGLATACGDVVHVLGCRLVVPEGWADAALEHFAAGVAAVAPLIVSTSEQQITAAGVNYGLSGSRKVVGRGLDLNSRRLSRLEVAGPTLEAGFYRRDVLQALGGWCEGLGDVADVDLARSFAKLDLRTAIATDSVVQERSPAPRQGGFSHGRALEHLFWRQSAGTNRTLAIALHSLAVGCEFLTRIPHGDAVTTLAGRLVGMFHRGKLGDYQQQLELARLALDGDAEDVPTPSTLSLEAAREETAPTTKGQRRRAA